MKLALGLIFDPKSLAHSSFRELDEFGLNAKNLPQDTDLFHTMENLEQMHHIHGITFKVDHFKGLI